MPAYQLGITVQDQKVVAMLASAPTALSTRLRQVIERAAITVQREMIQEAPIAVTGDLRRSIHYEVAPSVFQAVIEPDIVYAGSVEAGGPPRWVSVKPGTPLEKWAKLKGLNPYAVQRSIARKGTQPHPFVKPTYEKTKDEVEAGIEVGITQVLQEISNGGL